MAAYPVRTRQVGMRPREVSLGVAGKVLRLPESVAWQLQRSGLRRFRAGRALVDLILLPYDLHRMLVPYRRLHGRFPNLLRPRMFNEHLQRAKLARRHARYVVWADKIAVRDHVARTIGPEYLVPLLWTGTDLRAAPRAALPDAFVIKTNHGSGTNIIVRDKAAFDWDGAAALLARWLKGDHARGTAEWQYRWIEPRILIEPFLAGPDGEPPADWKFFCFHGRVDCVQVDLDRFRGHRRNFYDRDFRPLDLRFKYPRHDGPVARPAGFARMVQLAERLSAGEPFLRVDFYDCGGEIRFGELTLHPESGLAAFEPIAEEFRMGALMAGTAGPDRAPSIPRAR